MSSTGRETSRVVVLSCKSVGGKSVGGKLVGGKLVGGKLVGGKLVVSCEL